MALPSNQSIFERAQLIQRDVVGDLPPLNLAGSPKLGTLCRLNNGQWWGVVVDDIAPPHSLKWELINSGGGSVLPDQRFTVGRAAYALQDPGAATFTTVAAGIAAARAGTATTLGNASAASSRLVWIMPDTYAEAAIALRAFVHLQGGGPAAAATALTGSSITVLDSVGIVVIRDMRFDDCDFNIAPPAQPNLTVIFDNCEFNACSWASNAIAGGTLNVFFNGCTGSFSTSGDVAALGAKLTRVFSGSGANSAEPSRGLSFGETLTMSGAGDIEVIITQGQYFSAVPSQNCLIMFSGTVSGAITTEDCTLATSPVDSVFGSTSAVPGQTATWTSLAGTRLTSSPRSYWRTSTTAAFIGGQVEMLGHIILGNQWPLDPVIGGTVTSENNIPSNRERATQEFAFNVPLSQSAGGGPYANAAAAVAAMTVNGATSPYADSFRITPTYADQGVLALDPNTANFGTTFRFASFLLPDPTFLEDGRPYVIKNASDPADATSGPVALRLPNGSPSRVDYLQSDASINGVFDRTNYVILEPGQAVIVEVDRKGANAPAYLVTAVADALPGTAAPDQRFTVAPAGYRLSTPGLNTFLSPEDGIAAAFAGTGTTLPPVSGAEQRFVWIHPALYDGGQNTVALHTWIHLVGCADGAEAAILENYNFTLSESGDITISGIYFSNCGFVISGDGNIRFRDCRFEGCSLSHATNGDQTTYIFDNCRGSISPWSVDGTGPVLFNVVGSQQTGIATVASPLTLATDTIAMSVDGAFVELSLTGSVVFDYSGANLCAVTSASLFQLTVDGAKLTSGGAKVYLFDIAADAQVGVNTRGVASVPQTQYLANTANISSTLLVDLDQQQSEGNTLAQFFPTGITGPGSVASQTNSGSRPRGFTAAQSVISTAGTGLAAQSVTVQYGAFDRILLSVNYTTPVVLNPNTVAAQFQFASAILVDPKNLPIGHEIDVFNYRTTDANQDGQVGGPIALRLPNGTTSRIGFFVSDVSINPIINSTNYVILEPGQSCKLTVAYDDALGIYRYNVGAIGANTAALTSLESQDGPLVESDWYATAKDCWTLFGILPGFNGANSTAGYPFMPIHALNCTGARFYWASAVAGTVRVRLYNAAGAPIAGAVVDVPVNGIGDYTATFPDAINLSPLTRYWITTWLTSGAGWTGGISGGSAGRFLVAPQTMRGWVRQAGVCNSNGGGDVVPTAALVIEQPMLLVPTFNRI